MCSSVFIAFDNTSECIVLMSLVIFDWILQILWILHLEKVWSVAIEVAINSAIKCFISFGLLKMIGEAGEKLGETMQRAERSGFWLIFFDRSLKLLLSFHMCACSLDTDMLRIYFIRFLS